jgi:tRNA G10  N-methylase Trm11
MDKYLAPVPRGLHHIATRVLKRELSGAYEVKIDFLAEPVEDERGYCHYLASLITDNQQVKSLHDKDRLGRHVSLGYWSDGRLTWSTPGVWEGTVWLRLQTNAPASVIHKISVLGPLLAEANVWNLKDKNLSFRTDMETAVELFHALAQGNDYSLKTALDLWNRHVPEWPVDSDHLIKTKTSDLRYRVSCIRGDSKTYTYKRQDYLERIANLVVPQDCERYRGWKVDLVRYDIELVVLILSAETVAVGIALRPYQVLGVKTFSGNTLPPDISRPFVPGPCTRLRPTTARLLLELADIRNGDIVLDPFAGVGTIPFNMSHCGVGIGGDLCLSQETSEGQLSTAIRYSAKANNFNTNLCGWDASWLPLRLACIDAIVSDLPFGQQCLSSSKLNAITPLWIREMARILRPGTGRVVLLCGTSTISKDMDSCSGLWKVRSVAPVNINGLLAWIVMADRTLKRFVALPNHPERVRKLTHVRDRVLKCRYRDAKEPRTKTTRIS